MGRSILRVKVLLFSPMAANWWSPALVMGGTLATLAGFEQGWMRRKEPDDGDA